jgi:hypothetical protein
MYFRGCDFPHPRGWQLAQRDSMFAPRLGSIGRRALILAFHAVANRPPIAIHVSGTLRIVRLPDLAADCFAYIRTIAKTAYAENNVLGIAELTVPAFTHTRLVSSDRNTSPAPASAWRTTSSAGRNSLLVRLQLLGCVHQDFAGPEPYRAPEQ